MVCTKRINGHEGRNVYEGIGPGVLKSVARTITRGEGSKRGEREGEGLKRTKKRTDYSSSLKDVQFKYNNDAWVRNM